MKKTLSIFFFVIAFLTQVFSQSVFVNGSFSTNGLPTSFRGVANTYTTNALSGTHTFRFITADGLTSWGANSTSATKVISANAVNSWYISGGSASYNFVAGKYYTFNFERNASLAGVLETSTAPVSIPTVTQNPVTVVANTSVTINITTSSVPTATDNIYVRYTINSFATSTIVKATMSGTTGIAVIPAFTRHFPQVFAK